MESLKRLSSRSVFVFFTMLACWHGVNAQTRRSIVEGYSATNNAIHIDTSPPVGVGINTPNPTNTFQVSTNTFVITSGGNVGISTSVPEGLFTVANATFVVLNSGRVGIGTSNPSNTLSVAGDACIDTSTLCVDASNNRVGVLTTTPGTYVLDVNGNMRMGETNSTLSITAVNSVNAASMTVTETAPTANPPANRIYNDNIIKAWAKWEISGGAPAMQDDFNLSSTITDNGPGDFTFTIETDMASTNYVVAGDSHDSVNLFFVGAQNRTAGTVRIQVSDNAGSLQDSGNNSFFIVGNQ